MNHRRELSVRAKDLSSANPFAELIVHWQRRRGRHDLPWQTGRSAYRVWLSEIMLQQTQVATVIPYFARFVERFPDVKSLAETDPETVLSLWAGLGYYARARNLHACARLIVERHEGVFPRTVAELAALPGIGRSTAGAIVALAFGERAPILDGNAKRVLSRYLAVLDPIDKPAVTRDLWVHAERLAPDPTDIVPYTQGLMDLGATVCTPAKPCCEICPLQLHCAAKRKGLTGNIPARRSRPNRPLRELWLLLASNGRQLLFERRPARGLWGGLLGLPESGLEAVPEALHRLGLTPLGAPRELLTFTHALTHFRLRIHALHVAVGFTHGPAPSEGHWLSAEEALARGVPAPVARILQEFSRA